MNHYSENKLILENINKAYSVGHIFNKFTHAFEVGCHALLGPNGSGKSTLLKVIAGAETCDSGSIRLNNISLVKQPLMYKHKVSYAPDKLMMYPFLTGRQFINLITSIRKISNKDNVEYFIDSLKIEKYMNCRFDQMSL